MFINDTLLRNLVHFLEWSQDLGETSLKMLKEPQTHPQFHVISVNSSDKRPSLKYIQLRPKTEGKKKNLYTHEKTDAGKLIRYILVQTGENFEDLHVRDAKE